MKKLLTLLFLLFAIGCSNSPTAPEPEQNTVWTATIDGATQRMYYYNSNNILIKYQRDRFVCWWFYADGIWSASSDSLGEYITYQKATPHTITFYGDSLQLSSTGGTFTYQRVR